VNRSTNQVYPNLFSPITLAGKELQNRIVHAAMSLRYTTDGNVSEDVINYYVNRAKGGVSLAITEPMGTTRWNVAPRRIKVFGKSNEDGLKRFVDEVGNHECHMIGQLQDHGRGNHEGGRKEGAIGASPLPDGISWTVPRKISSEEIKVMINDFAESSAWLKYCGWSGVEISAGHGHIFHQFLSSNSNHRDDEYGGNIENRTRLIRDLIKNVRDLNGKDFIIGLKLPGEDGVEGGIDFNESKRISEKIANDVNVDYITFCWGAHADSLYWHLPDLHGERTPFIKKIKELSKPFGKTPVGALGLITDPNEGDHAIENGNADLIMLGRPLVTDAAWAKKSLEGRESQIRYCVSLNTCWQTITSGARIKCDNNPRVGSSDETDWKPKTSEKKKRIVIIGTGVSGMEAAWIAGARGHEVTVFGSSSEVGGKTRLHSRLPGGENLSSIYDYQELRASANKVKLELGVLASKKEILSRDPDAIIFATGSSMTWPSSILEEYKEEGFILDIRETMELLLERPSKQPGCAVVLDQDHTKMTYAATEWLAERFDKTYIITPRDRIASDEALVNRQGIYARLYKKKVELLTSSDLGKNSELEEGKICAINIYNEEEIIINNVSLLTFSTPRQPNLKIVHEMIETGIDMHIIGDANTPGNVSHATSAGNRIGNII